ncbi:DUF736 domain-containing protein [Thalassobaculum salexigens]|uniref:DUF736 domain-containing protein n=1 Tax=Thalassobaculum salexigens TaxID=455360 RepID=UPI000421723E|nr:DUF736 domain-containing protein [Thalassobaculum salexigens]
MATIGYVTKNGDTYTGSLKTLSIKAPIQIIPVSNPANDKAPDFRVMSDNIELGAGWKNVGQRSGNEYISLTLQAPEFGTIYANLGKAAGQDEEDVYALIWNPAR